MNPAQRTDIESVYKLVGKAIDEAGIDNAALYLAKVVLDPVRVRQSLADILALEGETTS